MRQFLLYLWLGNCFLLQQGWAQSLFSGKVFKHYTNENGLPQNSVKAIVEDELGFIWLATESGLVRFDGHAFEVYNRTNTSAQTSRMYDIQPAYTTGGIYAIMESLKLFRISKGKAYITDKRIQEVDLYRKHWANEEFLRYSWEPPSKVGKYTQDLLQLYLSDGIYARFTRDNKVTWKKDNKMLAQLQVGDLEDYRTLFALNGVIYRMPVLPGGVDLLRIRPSGVDKVLWKGDLLRQKGWATAPTRFICMNNASGDVFLYSDRHFYLLSLLPDGNIHTRLLLKDFDFPENGIWTGYYDGDRQRLFLGSLTQGLFVFHQSLFRSAVYNSGKGSINNVYDQVVFNDSTILTGKGVLFATGKDREGQLVPQIRQYENDYGNILRARDGTLYTGGLGSKYLCRFSNDGTTLLGKWPVDKVTSFIDDEQGNLFVAILGKGLYRFNSRIADSRLSLYMPLKERIGCLAWEGDNHLWMGTTGNLYKINVQQGTWDSIPELKQKNVRNTYVARKGEVWICTYENGLYLSLNDTLIAFPDRGHEAFNTIHKILEDDKGYFWISTNNGIFQVRRQDLLDYARKKHRQLYYHYYNKDAGFLNSEFNGGSNRVGNRLPNGYFSFSSMTGVVFFNPDHIKPDLPDLPIVLDELEVDGQVIPVTDSVILLNRHFKRLNVTFSSVYFGDRSNLHFQYRLENDALGEEWYDVPHEGVLSFTSLPQGRTKLLLRKQAGFGLENYTYAALSLYVPGPWWASWYFLLAGLLLLCCMVWGIILWRTSRWQVRNHALEMAVAARTKELHEIIKAFELSDHKLGEQLLFQKKMNNSITHDINTPLKYLMISSRSLVDKISKKELPALEEVRHIYTSSQRIYQYAQNLTGYMKVRLDSKDIVLEECRLHTLVKDKIELFRIAADSAGTTISNKVETHFSLETHAPLLSILLHNLLDNALKNTSAGRIAVYAYAGEDQVSIIVEDTGMGIPWDMLHQYNAFFNAPSSVLKNVYTGFGFEIIRNILPLLKARILIAPGPSGRGARFEVIIPVP